MSVHEHKRLRENLSLRLIQHHAMNTYGEVEAQLHAFLTAALDGREWSTE
jgi:hypothetical protein